MPMVIALVIFVGAIWIVRVLDSFDNDGISVAGIGIVPRTWSGLSGIIVAPLIHADWSHLLANTAPLLVLSILILFRGVPEYVFVLLTTAFVSGIGTWLFGTGNTQHIGASGVILGFMGFLLFRSAFDRRLSSFLITLIVAGVYASAVVMALVPRGWFSWTMHFFGFVGGFVAARLRYPSRRGLSLVSN